MHLFRATFSFNRTISGGLFAVLLGLLSRGPAHGGSIFVPNINAGTIGEYDTSGNTVNASLVTGLAGPSALGSCASYPTRTF
jgi:hypothetical protein